MSEGWGQVVKGGIRSFFEYDTPKIVHIRSIKVGLMNRLIQLAIIGYIIGWAIVYNKGYQEFDDVVSACSTKVKGVTYTNISDPDHPDLFARVWDVADYVIPAQENNAFFVMTNAIITRNQSQGICEEDPSRTDALCQNDTDCPIGEPVYAGNGVKTGKCINSTRKADTKVCQVRAWCDVEKDDDFPINGSALLSESKHFTVLLKNQIEFPKFGVKRRNILDTQNSSYLSGCTYHPHDQYDKFCPIFALGDIVNATGEDYDQMAFYGGFISINIVWNCDLDHSIDKCVPKYSFRRLDDPDSAISKGWNFRYANYYYENGVEYRDLIKAYGIRFIINVNGEAGKFSFIPLLFNLGSGLALLTIATVLCDFITIYILKKGYFYRDRKYFYVQDADNGLIEDADAPNTTDSERAQSTENTGANGEQRVSFDNPNYTAEDDRQASALGSDVTETDTGHNVRHRPGEYNRLEDD